jgi:hypothetical protein
MVWNEIKKYVYVEDGSLRDIVVYDFSEQY